ncbi:MAG: tyrosine-type recombinase/integrase [Lachnoclostridium edouardi]|uniref:tyrosine-type recombinase/integrase n=1 Tax=Lachnoclostridium edouardi TaxID=1926283 RepID=UPI0026DBB0DF|nr:tyrosine-type recombinase/integrase [Lachnoclostridium edouardi]MDO4277194.1 tyrosine-type recombinase/integrase [Lachnoclostridium edouardi]
MTQKKNTKQRQLPPGITYRPKEHRYMGRFSHYGERYTTYGRTLKEVKQNLNDLRYEVEHGTYIREESITFAEWFEIWIKDYKEPSVKMGTVGVYRQNYNAYIKNIFGNKQLREIRAEHIQRFYNGMSTHYAHNTLEVCRAVLNGAFSQAVKNEIIRKNPVSNTTFPKNNKKQTAKVMTMAEQTLFLKYTAGTKYDSLYEIALFTGMRSGELRGLRWEDVDFHKREIHVACTLTYQNGEYHSETPKTQTSDRIIPMMDRVFQLLKKQQKEQLKLRLTMGELWEPLKGFETLVFTNLYGRPINRDRLKREIDKIVKKMNQAGIPFAHITPHTFRHTFATRSIEEGMPPKVLQVILGHSDLSMTTEIYAHVLPDTKAEEMKRLEQVYFKIKQSGVKLVSERKFDISAT